MAPWDKDDGLAADWHDLLGRYHRTVCALDRALMVEHGIAGSEFEVLQQLHGAAGDRKSVRMHELGEQVHLSQSALSRLITRLEKDGLVSRGICEDDRRSAWVQMTEAGAQRFFQARPTHRAILHELATGGGVTCEDEAAAS
jgi:DNA-binding MarR family transcriptional regulator